MKDDEYVDEKEIVKFQKRHKDPNLYCMSERKEAKKVKLQLWRQQMKSLEDKKHFRKIYDRVGTDTMTLLEERDQARR